MAGKSDSVAGRMMTVESMARIFYGASIAVQPGLIAKMLFYPNKHLGGNDGRR